MGIISSKKGPTISAKDKAILELKVQRDKLKQYEKKVEQRLKEFGPFQHTPFLRYLSTYEALIFSFSHYFVDSAGY